MTVKEMIIYVDVAIDRVLNKNNQITKEKIIEELNYLAYNCNKKNVLLEKNYRDEIFF